MMNDGYRFVKDAHLDIAAMPRGWCRTISSSGQTRTLCVLNYSAVFRLTMEPCSDRRSGGQHPVHKQETAKASHSEILVICDPEQIEHRQ